MSQGAYTICSTMTTSAHTSQVSTLNFLNQHGHLSRDYSFSSPHISHLSAGSCSPFLTGPFHSKIWLQALSTLLSPGKLFAFSQSLSFLLHRRRINPGLRGVSHAGGGISRSFEPQRFFPPHIFLAHVSTLVLSSIYSRYGVSSWDAAHTLIILCITERYN